MKTADTGSVHSSCPGLSRASTSYSGDSKKDVDGRDKPGHDGR
jgi:penicillin-binding protein 1C